MSAFFIMLLVLLTFPNRPKLKNRITIVDMVLCMY